TIAFRVVRSHRARQPGKRPQGASRFGGHAAGSVRQTGVPAARDATEGRRASERTEMATEPLPVTGAWAPGDPPGNRKFFTFATDNTLAFRCVVVMGQ